MKRFLSRIGLVSRVLVIAVASFSFSAQAAEAQLAKQGTYSGHLGWNFTGNVLELEKGHIVWDGHENGTFFNDAGSGFLHLTAFTCTDTGGMNNGVFISTNGYCVVTDRDGDKAFIVWKCKGGTTRCEGDFQWTGGTGKYTGLTGNNTFHGGPTLPNVTNSTQGYSVWKGEWKLP
jgi:hypothetical protein